MAHLFLKYLRSEDFPPQLASVAGPFELLAKAVSELPESTARESCLCHLLMAMNSITRSAPVTPTPLAVGFRVGDRTFHASKEKN